MYVYSFSKLRFLRAQFFTLKFLRNIETSRRYSRTTTHTTINSEGMAINSLGMTINAHGMTISARGMTINAQGMTINLFCEMSMNILPY